MVKNFLDFMKPDGAELCSQKSTIKPHHD